MRAVLGFSTWLLVAAVVVLAGCSRAPHKACPDEDPLLERDAVVELARSMGLEEGLDAWSLHLMDHDLYGPVWRVQNTLYDRLEEAGGRVFMISARTGSLVDSLRWGEMRIIDGPTPFRIVPADEPD